MTQKSSKTMAQGEMAQKSYKTVAQGKMAQKSPKTGWEVNGTKVF